VIKLYHLFQTSSIIRDHLDKILHRGKSSHSLRLVVNIIISHALGKFLCELTGNTMSSI